jgi:diaminopimelate decarboxylase
MLKSFKSVSFDLKLFGPLKIAAGCLVAMLVLVHAYAAEPEGAAEQAKVDRIKSSAKFGPGPKETEQAKINQIKASAKFGNGAKETEQAKINQIKASAKFGNGAKADEQAKMNQIKASSKFGAGPTESAADKNKMQSKMGGMAMSPGNQAPMAKSR